MFPGVWFHLNIVSKMSFRTFASICKYLKKSKGGVCSCGNKKKLSFKDSQFELYCEDFIICFFKRFREIFVCKDQGQKTALNALDFCTLRCHNIKNSRFSSAVEALHGLTSRKSSGTQPL